VGRYNPHAPYVLGQEWVPIRGASYAPDNIVERGYTFRIEHGVTPVSGAYYVETVPDHTVSQVTDLISVYPAGREALTGPIKRLYVQPSAISTTGGGSIDISNGVAALLNPSDDESIVFGAPGNSDELRVSFDTEPHAPLLLGKRILDVRVRYSFQALDVADATALSFFIDQVNVVGSIVFFGNAEVTAVLPILAQNKISSLSLTDVNAFWQNTGTNVNELYSAYPWRFQELNRFRSGAAGNERIVVAIDSGVTSTCFLNFIDLEVIYCEETRVLYGGRRTTNINVSTPPNPNYYQPGAQLVQLTTPSFSAPSQLAPGEYTVVLNHNDLNVFSIYDGAPIIYAARELYQLPHQRGIRVAQSTTPGDTFAVTEDDPVLTHITLHTGSGVVTGSHAYGLSVGAPVYGTITATQQIDDDPAGSAKTYPQVRFYARRFGNTTVPLTLTDVATGTHTVSISVAEFDALEEVVDGWREVTLRFATPPTFSAAGSEIYWRWSAAGELAGNQWQVLAADSASATTPAALQTYPASYWAPFGATDELTWQTPTVSGTTEDDGADAVLIFSLDPPAVSGLTLETLVQEVTGVGLSCDAPPGCVPTGIDYTQLTWTVNSTCDEFSRSETDTWGEAPNGQTWLNSGGTADNYDVTNGAGTHTLATTAMSRNSTVTTNLTNQRVETRFSIDQVAVGNALSGGVTLRFTDTSNRYFVDVSVSTSNAVTLTISRQVTGTITALASTTIDATHYAGARYDLVVDIIESTIRARAAQVGGITPESWQLTVVDPSPIASGPRAGLRSFAGGGSTNVNPVIAYEYFRLLDPALAGGAIEIQRRDEYGDWQTVLLSNPCPTTFNDYEARVGVLSEYRVRTLNVLNFASPWVTGSATLPAPGVRVAGDANSILIFTSNHAPLASLAYTMQWQGSPVETFVFPEAGFVELQRMFGRDYFTAFYPLERGGEQFSRALLVNAAAVALPSLANMRGLRDLAWDQLDYVCVRDELGNRWFANVRVGEGVVRDNRRVYIAQVQVSQVTDMPSPTAPEV
jgi:hypothetical protein